MSRKERRKGGSGDFLAFLSFVAVLLLGLALLLSWVLSFFELSTTIAGWISSIAIGIALIVPLFLSFREARARGNVWFILWIIAALLVAAFYILTRITLPNIG